MLHSSVSVYYDSLFYSLVILYCLCSTVRSENRSLRSQHSLYSAPSSHAFSAQTVFELIKHHHAEANAPLLLSHNGTSGEGSGAAINTNGLRISILYGEYALPEGMAADSSDYIR